MAFSSLVLICLCSSVAWAVRNSYSGMMDDMQDLAVTVNSSDATATMAAPIWKGWTQKTLSLKYGHGPAAPPRFVEGSYEGTNALGGTLGTGLTKGPVTDNRILVNIRCAGDHSVTLTWNTRESKKGSPRERIESAKYYTKGGLKIMSGPTKTQRITVAELVTKGPAYDYDHSRGKTSSSAGDMKGPCNYEVKILPTPGGVEDYEHEFVLGTGQFQENEFPDASYGKNSNKEKDLAMEFVQSCGGCADGNPQTPEMSELCSCGKNAVLLLGLNYYSKDTWCGKQQWEENCGPVQFPWQHERTFYVTTEKMGLYLEG